MNRREFLRRSALIAAGVVAADQIELLERLAPRRLWPGASFAPAGIKVMRKRKPGMVFVMDSRVDDTAFVAWAEGELEKRAKGMIAFQPSFGALVS